MNDLKFALRQLLKNPGFTAVAVLTLALGIGATTAIFSVIHGVLISPYPYAAPEKIWAPGLSSASGPQEMRTIRKDEFDALAALPAFADLMGTSPGSALLTGEHPVQNLTAPRLTRTSFQFLGVTPVLGRTFGPGDFSPSGEPQPVTVISHRLWQKLFSGDVGVLGKQLRLDDRLHSIIGVMPPRFGWWTSDGLWLPLPDVHGATEYIFPIVRLAPGMDPSVARQQLQSLYDTFSKTHPDRFPKEKFEARLTNYLDMTSASGEMQNTLQLLFGAVGLLLLIACANIANLQLARASARVREMAVRLALGAKRARLVRQLLTESVLLAALGGVAGLALAVAITKLMVVLMPGFNVPNEARIEVNGPVLGFCLAVSLVTGVLFGLFPALQSTRPDLAGTLKDERASGGTGRGGWFRSSLIVAEVALSVVLLVCAGLTVRSFLGLQMRDPGFRPENVVVADVPLPAARYPTLERRNRFALELLERVQNLPGVEAAAIANGGTPFGGPRSGYSIQGQKGPEANPLTVVLASDGYFKTLGIGLRRGRLLESDDLRRSDRVCVINEAAAKLWPAGEDPLGRPLRVDLLAGTPGGNVFFATNGGPELTVVGICADTLNDGLARDTQPAAFIPFTLVAPSGRTLAFRTRLDPAVLFKTIREQVHSLDASMPLGTHRTLDEAMAEQTSQPRFTMTLFSLFATAGLTLAGVGLFSVLSYLVTRRTREIGVRMALGAQRSDVLGLVFKEGGRWVALGLLIGLVASVAATRLLGSQVSLHGVGTFDPLSLVAVAIVLAAIALLACWLPARRAARVEPMVALRSE